MTLSKSCMTRFAFRRKLAGESCQHLRWRHVDRRKSAQVGRGLQKSKPSRHLSGNKDWES